MLTATGHVNPESMKAMGNADCNYYYIFKNSEHAEHDFAANCVPSSVCKEDVVGMTKGMVATYGLVLQILQGNLGSLHWIGQGPTADCYAAMNKINEGQIKDLFVKKPGLVIGGHVITHKTVMEVPGMQKVDAGQSLKKCSEDPSVGYLYVHKNLYWSGTKDSVDLEGFSKFKQARISSPHAHLSPPSSLFVRTKRGRSWSRRRRKPRRLRRRRLEQANGCERRDDFGEIR